MIHAVCYPSANPGFGLACANAWMKKGYTPVIMFDRGAWIDGDAVKVPEGVGFHAYTNDAPTFAGYYKTINSIVKKAFGFGADLVTAIGDDMLPPDQGAEEHARLYFARFPAGEGVMQCTGDRQGEVIGGKVNSERICGSPTFGIGWHRRAFHGTGGFPEGFKSFYCDEALKESAERLGLLYQEPALKIDHVHWAFGRTPRQAWHERAQLNWDADQALFFAMRDRGFAE